MLTPMEMLKEFTIEYWRDTSVKIYLFSPWTRGEQRQSSDVDIAIAGGKPIAGKIAYFREKLE